MATTDSLTRMWTERLDQFIVEPEGVAGYLTGHCLRSHYNGLVQFLDVAVRANDAVLSR